MTALLLLAAGLACAAAPVSSTVHPSADWLKVYSMSPYREFWSVAVEVKSLEKDLPKVVQALEKAGAVASVPLEQAVGSSSAGTQQLMFRSTVAQADRAVKGMKKIGTVTSSVRKGDKLPLPEIRSKIDALNRDRETNAAELAKMPAVSKLVDTVLAHLISAQKVAETDAGEAVLNVTVVQKAPAKKP